MGFHRAGEEPIYAFKVDGVYYFKYYFDDTSVFKALSQFYDSEKSHFKFNPENLDYVDETLSEHGFSLIDVLDVEEFVVAKRKYTDHPDVLFKQSIVRTSAMDYNLFLMQDEDAVEHAITNGAIPISALDVSFIE